MRRYLLIGATIALLAVPALAFGRATTTTVTVQNNFFNPQTARKAVGAGAIKWQWQPGAFNHNVRQDVKLFYSGQPDDAPHSFTVVPSAGSFHYYCEVHRINGMQGSLKIKPLITPSSTGTSFGVRWAPTSSNTGGKFDVRYRVDGGAWKVWKNDTTSRNATFGLNGKPVTVRPGHTYDIQARSEKSKDTSKVSGWSPAAHVQT
jgi:plastocyanin